MSRTFKWCVNKTRLAIYNKQAFHIDRNGARRWVLNGKIHRENGPAIEYSDGYNVWYLNGKFHRVNGPAVEFAAGGGCWYLNGKLHRLNGPAIEFANGSVCWYLKGKEYSESDYWKELNK